MDDIAVKTACNKADIRAIEALAKEIWTQHYTPVIGSEQVGYMLGKFQSFDAIDNDINNKGYTYYIVFRNGMPCGYSAVKLDNGVFLSKFYVKQEARGNGAGKAMLGAINEYAKKHGQTRIWLTCNKHNPTLEIYKNIGYKITGEIVTDIGNGFVMDDYVLEKRI